MSRPRNHSLVSAMDEAYTDDDNDYDDDGNDFEDDAAFEIS